MKVFRYGANEYDDDYPGHDVVFIENTIGIRSGVSTFAFFILLSHALLHYFNSKTPIALRDKLDALNDRLSFPLPE